MDLLEKLKKLPNQSGVYQYFDKNGHLLYIGKAKSLKNRVKSYFRFTPSLAPADKLGPRIYKMISEVVSLEYIVVENENDALILENSLIKQLKPKYNILLRDDKTYPYIYVNLDEDFPRLDITRKIIKEKNIKYFGPYSSGARDIVDSIYEIVPLVQKKSCIKGNEACLFYQIGKCKAPCEGKISKDDYKKLVDEALSYVYSKHKILNMLNQKMEQFSSEFRFEEAMVIRDRISTIKKSQITSSIDLTNNQDIDLFAIKTGNDRAVIVRLFIREGRIASSSNDFIKADQYFDLDEAYKRAMINYYNQELPIVPKEILTAHEIEEHDEVVEFIENKFNKKINITTPKIGKKKDLITVALNNCDELLRIDKLKTNTDIYKELQELFEFDTTPYRFEVFDNSHMMGQATVGAMVVWDEKFQKTDYRHYNLEAKDEYGQMRELLTKRALSFDKNPPPDVWVIDGGSTLLNLAHDILESVGVNIELIAIAKEKIDAKAHRAKGAAKDIIHSREKEYDLITSDARLQFIQRLRDEAHRFAISFHKKQKRKEDKKISLLELHGIGEAKVKKLLNYFGTFEAISTANLDELKTVLNEKDSQLIINHFTSD